KKIAKAHQLPSAKDANVQAREEGRPILARDGYIYFGTDPERAKEGEDRRIMVYGVRRALEHLGSISLTGKQFLDYAMPHQLWTEDEAKIIKQALRWLISLAEAWDSHIGDADAVLKPSHDRAARKLLNHFAEAPVEAQRHFLQLMRNDIGPNSASEAE